MFEIYETKERIIEDNDAEAAKTRKYLADRKTVLINLMASPGAGKTTTLIRVINALKKRYRIGVMEADVDSAVDAEIISRQNVKVIQLHTGGSCHMDADMTRRGLKKMGIEDVDVVFLENVGNLVCPAEFDVGAALKIMILSVPEGDDKPLKYPLMFTVSDAVLINKIDTKEIFDFDEKRFEENVRRVNEKAPVFAVSAKNGDGFEEFTAWLEGQIRKELEL